MEMQWTQRMTDIANADRAYLDAHGTLPSLAVLGDMVGLSRERSRQLRLKIERFERVTRDRGHDAHVRDWKAWVFANALAVLPLFKPTLQRKPRAAKGRRHDAHVIDWRHWKWTRPRSQAELRELARRVHWSKVIYRSGTDEIVAITGGR